MRPETFIRLLRCFEPIDNKSDRWYDIVWPAIQQSISFDEHAYVLPRIVMSQIILGYPPKSLIEVVLSKEYLEEYYSLEDEDSKNSRTLRMIYWYALRAKQSFDVEYKITGTDQLKQINEQSSKNHDPLIDVVANEIGDGKYLNFVSMENDVVMEVIKVNKKTGQLTDIRLKDESLRNNTNEPIPAEMIVIEPDELL